MTIKGNTVYKAISSSVADMEKKYNSFSGLITEKEKRISNLMSQREKCLSDLAEIYVPELKETAVCSVREAQAAMREALKKKNAEYSRLTADIEKIQQKKVSIDDDVEKLTKQLDEKAGERDRIKEQMEKDLSLNSDYLALTAGFTRLKAAYDHVSQRAAETKADMDASAPGYMRDKKFKYLASRNYGTKKYEEDAWGFTKFMDGLVAKCINFKEQRARYENLVLRPKEFAALAEEKQAEYSKAQQALLELRARFEKDYGVTALNTEGAKLQEEREELLNKIAELDKEYSQKTKRKQELDNTKDEYYTEAVKNLKSSLNSESLTRLRETAAKTPDPRDDRLVEKIEQIDSEIRNLKDSINQTKQERTEYGNTLEKAREVSSTFKKKTYDSERSVFTPGFDAASLLAGYIAGTCNEASLWDSISSAQSFKKAETVTSTWGNSSLSYSGVSGRTSYSDSHSRSSYSDSHSRSYSDYSDAHSRSHSNYSDAHSRSHSNYSDAHSNAWDFGGSFGGGGGADIGGSW